MSKITNYAIIDHVGSIEMPINKAYSKIFHKANAEGFNKTNLFTMKKLCQMDSPYAKEITDKMKYRIRYQKNPKKVYFVCPELNYYTERELKKWYDRCIEVEVFETNTCHFYKYETVYDTHEYNFHDNKTSKLDRIIEMYAPAFGWTLEAPISRIDNSLVPDNFCKRPDHDKMVSSGETHFTKPFTRKERFYEYQVGCLSKTKKKEFLIYFDYILKASNCSINLNLGATFGAISGDIKSFSEFLDVDYIICEECNRPHRLHQGDIECPHCAKIFTEDYILDTYFEDNYTDDYENNPYLDNESSIATSKFFTQEIEDELILELE